MDSGLDEQPAFSPDGQKIAFSSGRAGNVQIYVMDADGSDETRLTNRLSLDREPAFSPDGAKIVFARSIQGASGIYTINAYGSGAETRLTTISEQQNRRGVLDANPAFSPDGTRIVFERSRGWLPATRSRLYTVAANGGQLTRLSRTTANDRDPDWGVRAPLPTPTP